MRSVLSIVCALSLPSVATAATITVDDSGSADFATISDAIDAASPGDIVQVSPGTYTEDLDFSGKAITVRGTNGAGSTFLQGTGTGPVVRFVSLESNNAVLEGFDIRGGDTVGMYMGGGVHISNAGPTLRGLVIHDNVAHLGGGVFLGDAVNAVLDDLLIRDNVAMLDDQGDWGYGGGVYAFDSSAELSDCIVQDNVAERGGGLMFGNSTVSATGLNVKENEAERGGGVSLLGGVTDLSGSILDGNTAGINGGGFWHSVDAAGTFLSVLVTGNVAPSGAGGRVTNSSPSLEHVTFVGNVATGNGGGLLVDAIDDDADVAITACLFDGNEAEVGGGLLVSQGSVVVSGSRFTGNAAGNLGGAVYLSEAQASSLVLSTFDGNNSGSDGGAVRVQDGGPHAITSSIFSGNSASNGAAVHVGFGGEAEVRSCTMVGHSASSGGAVRVTSDSTLTVIDSIVAFAGAGSGMSAGTGSTWDITYNAVHSPEASLYSGALPDLTGFAGNIDADPQFRDWTDNGVHDDNLRLAGGSPCIDAGAPTSPTDPDGSPTDMGAFGGVNGSAWGSLPDPGHEGAGTGGDDDDDGDDDDATGPSDDDDATADDDDATADDDDATGLSFDPDPEPLDEGGCGCSASTERRGPWWLLAVLGICAHRRRP
ncbi:MAG: hypothetical protein KDA24_10430 [Deltaproteobacteria bacterium]|nr:hypothetical protein [Deltaproteobacteria bacterium]